jgi:hypothetical protein
VKRATYSPLRRRHGNPTSIPKSPPIIPDNKIDTDGEIPSLVDNMADAYAPTAKKTKLQ